MQYHKVLHKTQKLLGYIVILFFLKNRWEIRIRLLNLYYVNYPDGMIYCYETDVRLWHVNSGCTNHHKRKYDCQYHDSNILINHHHSNSNNNSKNKSRRHYTERMQNMKWEFFSKNTNVNRKVKEKGTVSSNSSESIRKMSITCKMRKKRR